MVGGDAFLGPGRSDSPAGKLLSIDDSTTTAARSVIQPQAAKSLHRFTSSLAGLLSTRPKLTEERFSSADQLGMATGLEWVIDAFECTTDSLSDLEVVTQICLRVIEDLGLKVVGHPQTHRFSGPGGVTALYMLSESHLACHTYPEHGTATFNLYCCRARPTWDWDRQLRLSLGAGSVSVRRMIRGAPAARLPLDCQTQDSEFLRSGETCEGKR